MVNTNAPILLISVDHSIYVASLSFNLRMGDVLYKSNKQRDHIISTHPHAIYILLGRRYYFHTEYTLLTVSCPQTMTAWTADVRPHLTEPA